MIPEIDKLAWIDLETTGLEPLHDKVIEIGALVTDRDLNILDDKGFHAVIHIEDADLKLMDEVVIEMHTKNGLIDDCFRSKLTLEKAETELIRYFSKFFDKRTAPLCCTNVAFDRAFIMNHMRRTEEYLRYNNIDISTIKQFIQIHNPNALHDLKTINSNHRALDDIRESISQLKQFTKILIK